MRPHMLAVRSVLVFFISSTLKDACALKLPGGTDAQGQITHEQEGFPYAEGLILEQGSDDVKPEFSFATDLHQMETIRQWADCIANKPKPWLMFAGDSNWRHIFLLLKDKFVQSGLKVVSETHASAPSGAAHCDDRWIDHDFVLQIPWAKQGNKLIRISLRFMSQADLRIPQMTQDMNEILVCGKPSAQPPAFAPQYWGNIPSGLILTHGLWGLPGKEQNNDLQYCERYPSFIDTKEETSLLAARYPGSKSRYTNFARAMSNFTKAGIPYVRWATNFRVATHPQIRIADVNADLICQQNAARQMKVDLLDVFHYTVAKFPSPVHTVHCPTYHFDLFVQNSMLADTFRGYCSK